MSIGSRCDARHQQTGARCTLRFGHLVDGTPHVPEELDSNGKPLEPVESSQLTAHGEYAKAEARKTARQVQTRTRVKAGIHPEGTFPIRPPKIVVCIYDCPAPAKPYPCGPRCDEHSPAAERARRETGATP